MSKGKLMNPLVIGLFFILSATSVFAAPLQSTKGGYPDVWYRLYDWPVHVCDMFFSDKEIWGDEPVLILCRGNQREAIAEGFFSKRRLAIKRTRIGNRWDYTYWPSKKAMSTKYTYKSNDDPVLVRFDDGGRLEFGRDRIEMYWHGFTDSDSWAAPKEKEKIGIFPLIWSAGCEPLTRSLRRLDGQGNLLWEKTTTRYYRKEETPPPNYFLDANHPGCDGYKAWLSEGAEPNLNLRLSDESLLTTSSQFTYVIRIRLNDGESKELPSNLAVLDLEAVIAAKRKMVAQYLSVVRKAKENSKDGPEFLHRYHDLTNPEKVYRELAGYLFESTIEQE